MNNSAAPVLLADGLHKRYGDRSAVQSLSLQVQRGELLGLLGPNGAGKSTTLAMIAGLTTADRGKVSVCGEPISPALPAGRQRIGLVTQDLALYDGLSAQANAELFGALYGLDRRLARQRATEVLAQVGLAERAGERPTAFSGGMKRRLHIACALVHRPDLLLLDEPTAGVDPQSRNAIFELLHALRAAGQALVYTTHYMEEVERLADRIVIIDHGQVVAEGTLQQLLQRLPASQKLSLVLDAPDDEAARARQHALLMQPGVVDAQWHAGCWTLAVDPLGSAAAAVCAALHQHGVALRAIDSGQAGLEDVFLMLTGRALRE